MSKIDKLSILGVRSFDNQRSETIQFYAPLTLIVGLNGSGKTTIIECLKYATTGELPPNSARGGAFIHDPKLCGEKEVLAQVKLSFKATSGAKMVATRSLQVTVKKTTRAQKALEGQLLMIKDGERTAISSRVAELDQIMPQYLGVSKSILENVIFCHQDESLWPLSEPGVLKKKFDEIFEALKYTKAIDNIKVLKKKQNEELAKFKIIEQHAKEDKDRGDRAEKKSNELYAEIEELRAHNDKIAERLEEAKQKANEAWAHADGFTKIVSRLEGKRIEEQTLARNVDELKHHIKEMTDTDEQLQKILDQYEERVSHYQDEAEEMRREYSKIKEDIDQTRREIGVKQSEVGRFRAEKAQFERQVQQREILVKETARRHGIRGYDLEVGDAEVREFIERVSKMARDQNNALERARRETQEALQQAQKVLNQFNERKSALQQKKENSRSQIGTNDRKMMSIQSQLDKVDIDEGGKAVLESSINDVEKRLDKAKVDLQAANLDTKITDADSQQRTLEDQKERLDAELIEGTRQAGDTARLDFLQKEQKDRQQKLDTMIGAHGPKITTELGVDLNLSSLERDFQSASDQRSGEVKESEAQRDGVNREIEHINFKIKSTSNELKKRKQELKEHERRILEVMEDEDAANYPEDVAMFEEDLDAVKRDTVGFGAEKEFFKQYLKIAKGGPVKGKPVEPRCELCQRHFQGETEKTHFIRRLEKLISSPERQVPEGELESFQERLTKAREANPSYVTWLRLKEEDIPKLEKECRNDESRREDLLRKAEEHDQVVKEKEAAKREIEALSKTVQSILRYHTELHQLQTQIQELSKKRQDTGLSRGLEDIQNDSKKLNEQLRELKARTTQLLNERDRGRSQVHQLEAEVNQMRTKLSTAIFKLKEKSNFMSQMEELKSFNTEQREDIRQADQDIQALAPQISQAQAKYDDIEKRGNDRQRELNQDASKISDSLNQLRLADQEVNSYLGRGGDSQLHHAEMEIKHLEEEVIKREDKQRHVIAEIKKIDDTLRNTADMKRQISDNLRYRAGARNLQSVRGEIEELESHNAYADKERYEREGNRWQNERNKLSAEQASTVGTLKSKDDQLAGLLKDWETDYQDAAYKYREAHIKVETTKAVVEDLGRYGGALDKAIMRYHGLKMEEINRIIEELWKKTYQGTDVDTIIIRSDNENVKGNKSYNYRVCMVKQDAEMDMRGRCSAGQKVLASIIIRLALAECFGVNCGLIALDEPTTNLDRDNIKALAESLAEIIRVRRQQSNFQLIVITHDEEFLRHMQCADFSDTYYRVSRNERQKSIIERQSIAEVV